MHLICGRERFKWPHVQVVAQRGESVVAWRMSAVRVLLSILVGCTQWHLSVGQASAPAPAIGGVCGDEGYKITLCFPGSLQNATCTYSITQNYTFTPDAYSVPIVVQVPCIRIPIFQGGACNVLPGVLNIAFGPCNARDVVPAATPQNSLPVVEWLRLLGLGQIQEMGSLYVRGYSYQQMQDLDGLSWFPQLTSFSTDFSNPTALKVYQVTLTGLPVPRFPALTTIPRGLSILNSNDTNFADRFPSLTTVSGGLSIAGCNSLMSLEGFERVGMGQVDADVQLINNLLLPDVSALSRYFSCRPDGTTSLDPSLVIGTVGAHPLRLQPLKRGCALHTLAQMCQYIRDDTHCPQGTEYLGNADNTIRYVESSDFGPAPGPSPKESLAPAPSLFGLPVLPRDLP